MEVVKIGKAKPDDEVIKELKMLLEQAESGRLRGLFCAAVMASEETIWVHVGSVDRFAALGRISRALHNLNKSMDEDVKHWSPDEEKE